MEVHALQRQAGGTGLALRPHVWVILAANSEEKRPARKREEVKACGGRRSEQR